MQKAGSGKDLAESFKEHGKLLHVTPAGAADPTNMAIRCRIRQAEKFLEFVRTA